MSESSSSNTTTHKKMDSFMASMTFASSGGRQQCDCDECEAIPLDVLEEVRKRKRLRIDTRPLKRTQDRTLIRRDNIQGGGISAWNLVLPINAEPLVEFGTSHRLVWVKRLPQSSSLKSIGTGIIGSSYEEQNRITLDWKEGKIYLVKSGGTAVGWVHTRTSTVKEKEKEKEKEKNSHDDSTATISGTDDATKEVVTPQPTSLGGPAIFVIVKVPPAALKTSRSTENNNDGDDDDETTTREKKPSSWIDVARSICIESVKETQQAQARMTLELSDTDSLKLKEALKQLDGIV